MEKPALNPPAAASQISRPRANRLVFIVILTWFAALLPLAWLGLPSRQNDDLLFGGEPAWDAARFQITDLARQRAERGGGADTDLNPVSERDQLVDMTPDDAARAAILLRYRLYSHQPDEMITFMALQRMHPRRLDFDPKLYQYGGAYIYLIGATIGASSVIGLTHLTTDLGYYISHPEEFGRFYVVSRIVSLVFGAAALLAVFRLGWRAGGATAGWLAMFFTIISPVFITMALEAKPHVAAVALTLWAILAAWDCWEFKRRQDWIRLGIFSGLAFGFVLTGITAVMLPIMVWGLCGQAHRPRFRTAAWATGLALLIYAATNPYLLINLVGRAGSLGSNLGNSTAMYRIGSWAAGLERTIELLVEGSGPLTVLFALLATVWLAGRNWRLLLILGGPSAAMFMLCTAIGAGKPAEFGRFLLLPAIFAGLAGAVGLATLGRQRRWISWVAAFAIALSSKADVYIHAFVRDRGQINESRRLAAVGLSHELSPGDTLAVTQEPAPYCTPPIDFAHRRVVLLPASKPTRFDVADLPPWLVLTADLAPAVDSAWWQAHYQLLTHPVPQSARLALITWADKPVFFYRRNDAPR